MILHKVITHSSLPYKLSAILKFLDELSIAKAVFGGCSWGGYIMFEIWRQSPQRVGGFIFCNTRADQDPEEARLNRYKTAEQAKVMKFH